MRGHEPLIALRRRGKVPARGVVIDAGRTGFNDCETWAPLHWPRAFVEIDERDKPHRLDLCWTSALRVVLVRQPFFPMPAFAEITRAVLAHHPDLLTTLVLRLRGEGEAAIHHHRAGTWSSGWPSEELESAAQGWPNLMEH